jgi:hypothetical protein
VGTAGDEQRAAARDPARQRTERARGNGPACHVVEHDDVLAVQSRCQLRQGDGRDQIDVEAALGEHRGDDRAAALAGDDHVRCRRHLQRKVRRAGQEGPVGW